MTVIFIGGVYRSGSTLLARLLGQYGDIASIGELKYLFDDRMRERDIPCSCGRSVAVCDYWRDISQLVSATSIEFVTNKLRMRHVPRNLRDIDSLRNSSHFRTVTREMSAVLDAVQTTTNADVVLDISKFPSFALILSQMPDVNLVFIHLIRDVRGVIASSRKRKGYLGSRPWYRVCAEWTYFNAMSERVSRLSGKSIVIRYEDLADDPLKFVTEIRALARLRLDQPRTGHNEHLLAGNPDKLGEPRIQVARQGWQLPRHLSIASTLLTASYLRRYGYSLAQGFHGAD